MLNSGFMKKVARWLALALAVAGLVQTPFLIPEAVSQAAADHRLIFGYLVGFSIRFLFIIFFAKFWWDTRARTNSSTSQPKP
jgi:FtsH-binding integral membrane protein